MSKVYDIPNDEKTAQQYINFLLSLSFVDDVYIAGSRSPLTTKQPRTTSDWDLQAICSKVPKKIFFINPRAAGIFNADVHWNRTATKEAVHYSKILTNGN